jgi:hypothetical protein
VDISLGDEQGRIDHRDGLGSYNAPARQVLKALVKRLSELVETLESTQRSTKQKRDRA